MSIAGRRRAVALAEARAQACIAHARQRVALTRDDHDSALYPLAVGGGGLLAGVLLERAMSPGERQPASAERQDATSPGWLSLANTGLALRLWQQARPLLDALSRSAQGDHPAASDATAAAGRREASHG